ncbi:MAG: glutamate racemase [Chitinophagales bacterium]|nr:glutamate racemase [Chitinophagales bacterium]
MANRKAIGIFDSGIGGLTVASAISKLMPDEQIIYFGDTEHMPYGEKSEEAIRYFSKKISAFLIEQDCKAIIIACNTASSLAFQTVLDEFGDKAEVFNVVDPIVEAVTSDNSIDRIGIIGTKQTIKSNVYEIKLKEQNKDLQIKSFATPLLAQMIEEGFFNCEISRMVVDRYLEKANFENLNGFILACTHYPMIKQDIINLYGDHISIYDSTKHVAEHVKKKLTELDMLTDVRQDQDHFYVSDLTESFANTASLFYQGPLKLEKIHLWEDQVNAL